MIDIRLLGPLEVSGPDARQIEISSQPQRRLISVLALHVGSVVRGATLEDRLDLSAGALRTSISRLRQLASDVSTPATCVRRPGTRGSAAHG